MVNAGEWLIVYIITMRLVPVNVSGAWKQYEIFTQLDREFLSFTHITWDIPKSAALREGLLLDRIK